MAFEPKLCCGAGSSSRMKKPGSKKELSKRVSRVPISNHRNLFGVALVDVSPNQQSFGTRLCDFSPRHAWQSQYFHYGE